MPIEECIDLAVKYIFDGNPDLKLSNTELKSLKSLFKGSFYDQIDGVAMGSPLAPILANLFMGHHEKLWLEHFQDSEILFYRRYVDDTFFFLSFGESSSTYVLTILIIHMKKLLDCDWLRAVQFKCKGPFKRS